MVTGVVCRIACIVYVDFSGLEISDSAGFHYRYRFNMCDYIVDNKRAVSLEGYFVLNSFRDMVFFTHHRRIQQIRQPLLLLGSNGAS